MHWFKNLDATPRLLTSFGFMIALALGMGYLGVSSLNKSNHGSQQLYQEDMLGSLRADQMALDRAEIGRLGRDAVLHAGDPEIVGKDEKGVVDAFASLSSNLSESQAKVQSQEGQAQLAIIEASIPPYRQFFFLKLSPTFEQAASRKPLPPSSRAQYWARRSRPPVRRAGK